MTGSSGLTGADVARHWPYVCRNLVFDQRARAIPRALEMLAELQVAATGEPVELGRSRIVGREMTPGEAGAVWRALTILESRRVVVRQRGRGRIADAWGFAGEVVRWRRMPWGGSSRDVEQVLRACICRAPCASAARVPGQSVAFPRGEMTFMLSDADHLWRPGEIGPDPRGRCARRAADAQRPGTTPVETRGKCAGSADGYCSSSLGKEEEEASSSSGGEVVEKQAMVLRRGVLELTGNQALWGRPARELAELAARLSADQAEAVVRQLAGLRRPDDPHPVRSPTQAVALAAEIARSPAVAGLSSRPISPPIGSAP